MTIPKQTHAMVFPLAGWGHVRPLLHLVINALQIHPGLHLTLLLQPSVAPKVERELKSASLIQPVSGGFLDRMQCFNIGTHRNESDFLALDSHEEIADFIKALPEDILALYGKGQGVGKRQNKFIDIPPSFAFFDLFQSFIPDLVSETLGSASSDMIPLLGFCPSNAVAIFHHFASESQGGFIELLVRLVDEDVAKGMDRLDAWGKHVFASYGILKDLPGLPAKYDYELRPLFGAVGFPPSLTPILLDGLKTVKNPHTTALITSTPGELEPEAHKACEEAFGKKLHMAGLQFPESVWQGKPGEPGAFENPDDQRVMAHMDSMLKKHGERSVVYASFGSMFWPILRPELVAYLLDSLMTAGSPFVFAYASELAQLPEDLKERVAAYGDGIIVKFAPQWQVLDHPASGFFVSHCGSNSTAEAILTSTPMACMPFTADRENLLRRVICDNWKAGVMLKQTFTFSDKRFTKLSDGTEVIGTEEAIKAELADLWSKFRGPEGQEMRRNMGKIRAICEESWKTGESRQTMESIAQYF